MVTHQHKERNVYQLALINRGGKGAHKSKKHLSKQGKRKQKHKGSYNA